MDILDSNNAYRVTVKYRFINKDRTRQICTTYLIAGRGHMNNMTDEEKEMIRDFFKSGEFGK